MESTVNQVLIALVISREKLMSVKGHVGVVTVLCFPRLHFGSGGPTKEELLLLIIIRLYKKSNV